ncbi:glycoside hydrolase family 130 protein [Flavobacterium subsaxonicum]|uniref:Glycosidase n=1 Tax=Flavobacterium subsaxonicum WB 4.1-42 = DSM 21790 TaxID=1121898 RepID=A0A0A2MKU4_9FLAO|nr:glycoside hydrolase family 130 protein [Flavobacterium subsaxonicum]KGO93252.1 glycosidase [Flavobacterium subsaxonicum WB 4.1-42 = DSM 21790]
MRLSVERKPVKVLPDTKRVIARYFFNGEERAVELIKKIMQLDKEETFALISPLLQDFSKRHRNITRKLLRNAERVRKYVVAAGFEFEKLDEYCKLLIGSYFTHEYSIESAAFFNPSIIPDPDQSNLEEGQLRVIISFRAVGEGHVSSVVFRRAMIDKNSDITVIPAGNYIDEAEKVHNVMYQKRLFLKKAAEADINSEFMHSVSDKLEDRFNYDQLKQLIIEAKQQTDDVKILREYNLILALSDSYRRITFSKDTDISDRVIFPLSDFESKGIEDARFVLFTDENGKKTYYATYTAYDGVHIMPKLLKTYDFYDFKTSPLNGAGAKNKNLALFPRKINGKFAMLSRIDGWNNYLMYSDNINEWEDPIKIQGPEYPWEFVQIGNCGSPIETPDGWLVITHSVGSMRRYSIGASLLDINDPSIEIGRLKDPLIVPNPDEREGYVPNVVYSCGSIIHNDELILPYGLSDHSSGFATVKLQVLLDRLKTGG